MKISSPAFENGGNIPQLYTCEGSNLSPPLQFFNVPKQAKSLAVLVNDPDAQNGGFVHWVIFDIPANAKGIMQGAKKQADFPKGTREGVNDAQLHGYSAPCPPSGTHHYEFTLYALDERIDRQGLTKTELENSMRGHVVEQAQLVGMFHK